MKKFKYIFTILFLVLLCASCTGNNKKSDNVNGNTHAGIGGGTSEAVISDESLNATEDANWTINTSDADGTLTSVIVNGVKKAMPSTVTITASQTSSLGVSTAGGSGVIFSKDSNLNLYYIVTCFHVIENMSDLTITLSDEKTSYKAAVVGGYADEDIAVLSIEASNLTTATLFYDSQKLLQGQDVFIIGNPASLPNSVSKGVVSYLNRSISTDGLIYQDVIQTDTSVNGGNSGGGMFDVNGNLVGIVNAKKVATEYEGLGYAIPINTVVDVLNHFKATAKYDKTAKKWQTGYVAGDWELGFSLSQTTVGNFFQPTIVTYVQGLSNNPSSSKGSLDVQKIIKAIRIEFADSSKAAISLDVNSISNIYSAIYSRTNPLNLHDKIILTYNDDQSTEITVELIQYRYMV